MPVCFVRSVDMMEFVRLVVRSFICVRTRTRKAFALPFSSIVFLSMCVSGCVFSLFALVSNCVSGQMGIRVWVCVFVGGRGVHNIQRIEKSLPNCCYANDRRNLMTFC